MGDVALGIDIGTSYTKAAARAVDGTIVAVCRKQSPQLRINASNKLCSAAVWWECIKNVLHELLLRPSTCRMCVKSICVSAIAPTLTLFDARNADSAYSILYSSLTELEGGESLSPRDTELTKRRLHILKHAALKERLTSPHITDLVGYVNWRLTGALTINSISLAEMGLFQGEWEILAINNTAPQIVAVRDQIGLVTTTSAEELGIKPGVPVCGGCPDTISSIIGAGLTKSSEKMLYLGTFGSLLNLEQDVNVLLDETICTSPPFRWLLSVPGFGPKIESLGQRWFRSVSLATCLNRLDQAAAKGPPGAGGTLFLMPRWKIGMRRVGEFELVADKRGEIGDLARQARAVLEGIAYAALAIGICRSSTMKVSGGGARSRIWLDIISTILGSVIQVQHMAWEAAGAADIAAMMIWKSVSAKRPCYRCKNTNHFYSEAINDNRNRIYECYHERNWL